MLQKLSVNNFESIEDTSQFSENFMKSYNEESDEGYFLEIDVQCPEKLYEFQNDLPFSLKRIKVKNKKSKSLLLISMRKLNMLSTWET